MRISAQLPASPVPLPEITRADGQQFEAVQTMVPGTGYQDGHYPGNPIYPGVFFIESVINSLRVALGRHDAPLPVQISRLIVARFLRPGTPGERFSVHLRVAPASPSTWDVEASCTNSAAELMCEMTLQASLVEGAAS